MKIKDTLDAQAGIEVDGNFTVEDLMQGTGATPGLAPAGYQITPNMALSLTAVWGCVARISNPLAIFPVDVVQETSTGKEKRPKHMVYKLLNQRANPYMTARTLRKTGTGGALLHGNGYIEIQRDRLGRPAALWPLLPWSTFTDRVGNKLVHRTHIDGKSFDVPDKDCLHVLDFSLDGYNGLSPIQQAAHSVGLTMAAEEFGGKFFSNDAKSGGFLMIPGRLSPKGKRNVQDSLQEQGGLDNAHRVKVLEEGAKFINTTIPPDAAQFLGTRDFQISEIARLYNVPLHMLQAETKSTSWGSGLEQLGIGFVQHTLQPWVNAWEAEINVKMFSPSEIDKGYSVRFNLDELLRGDSAARASFYDSGIAAGWLLKNEARIMEGLEPIDGLDDATDDTDTGSKDNVED